jgi:exopolyphosphatase / guanosine-5'-triphosphate,3'-diphosphate pyrophosphatase
VLFRSPLIGIGGTIRNIGKIDRKKRNYPLDISHNYHMTNLDISEIYNMVNDCDPKQKKKVKGLSKERADIFTGAAAALNILAQYCGITDLYVSGSGLREGLIYEYILNCTDPVDDVLDFSLNTLIINHRLNKGHALHVWNMVDTLYDQLEPVHNIPEKPCKILKTAALLHDIGINISYYDHHKHSFYMILNSQINSLSHKELLIAACTAASHRKDEFKLDEYNYQFLLNESDILLIQKLGIMLKICESLDRRMNGNIEGMQCVIHENTVIIKLFSKENPALEINDALNSNEMFEKLFNKKLFIV